MNRKVAALALGALVMITGACSKDDAATTPTTSGPGAGPVTTDYVPSAPEVVPVSVTKAVNITPVAAEELPVKIQAVATINGLTPDEQTCVNATIKGTVDQDPTIADNPGKLASVGGQSVVVCAGAERVGEVLSPIVKTSGDATDEQMTCFKQSVGASPEQAADLMSTLFTLEPTAILEKIGQYEQTCGFKFKIPGS